MNTGSANRKAHDCRAHFVSMNSRDANDRDPPLWCPVCGSVKHTGSIVHLRPSYFLDASWFDDEAAEQLAALVRAVREDARAEAEKLKNGGCHHECRARIVALEAEVENARREYIAALEAENARLREALVEIAIGKRPHRFLTIAQEALTGSRGREKEG